MNPKQSVVGAALRICSACSESMIPKSGNRFSVKIMLKPKNLDCDPIQLNWITI
jgi:hypothetical protein